MSGRLRALLLFLPVVPLSPVDPILADPTRPGVEVTCADFRTTIPAAIYAQRLNGGGEVPGGWTPDPASVCLLGGEQKSFTSAADGAGGAFVAWVETRADGSNVRVLRLDTSGAVVSGWPALGITVAASLGEQYGPRIIADGAGGAYVGWLDFRGQRGRVYVRRIAANGGFPSGWQSDGVPVSNAAGDQSGAVMVADGAGGALILWQDRSATATAIRAQRLTGSAAVATGWPAAGRVLCASAFGQFAPASVTDGAGGAIVVWQEARDGPLKLYALRFDGVGQPAAGWPASGLQVASGTSEQRAASIVSDGASGAVIAWTQSDDIYAQRLSSFGGPATGWPGAGLLVCGSADQQYGPVALADGTGGAFIAWEDYRAGDDGDIYAE